MLERHPDAHIDVLAVWEPILPTDWMAPTSGTLARLADARVSQYWDADHAMAARMAADARQPQPHCCTRHDVLWDLAAVYPPGVRWADRLPPALFFDGPVVDHASDLESVVARATAGALVR